MNERNSNHGNEGPEHNPAHAVVQQLPYWKRAHHDWKFWIGFVLMFVAIAVYVMSDNLAFVRRP